MTAHYVRGTAARSSRLNGMDENVRIDVRAYVAAAKANGATVDATDAANIVIEAMQAQLGLRVESRKADAVILVVDKASKTPTEKLNPAVRTAPGRKTDEGGREYPAGTSIFALY